MQGWYVESLTILFCMDNIQNHKLKHTLNHRHVGNIVVIDVKDRGTIDVQYKYFKMEIVGNKHSYQVNENSTMFSFLGGSHFYLVLKSCPTGSTSLPF